MIEWQRIHSRKHPGAVFFKRRGSRDDFVCKVYPNHEREAALIQAAPRLEDVVRRMVAELRHGGSSQTKIACMIEDAEIALLVIDGTNTQHTEGDPQCSE